MDDDQAPNALHREVAQALTVFEHAVRRHASAQSELRIARRSSTTKAALNTADEVTRARLDLTRQLERLGWQPPPDITLAAASIMTTRNVG